MGRDPLDELAGSHSEVSDIQLQPDPAVLRVVVVKLRSVREEAKGFGIPDDFVQTMTESLVECFRKLDALSRDDPFWEETNRRPTPYKLSGFCRKLAEDLLGGNEPPTDPVQVVWLLPEAGGRRP